jgi:nitrogen fixation/metabolism regulation signal transduction histidine kinase
VSLQAYALLALTALMAVVVGLLIFAAVRLLSAGRRSRVQSRDGGESPLMAAALQEAIQKLRAQERAMTERAEASERLNTQIVNSLTAGLLVVDRAGQVQILNPGGRRMLGIEVADQWPHYTGLPVAAAPLAGVIEECLASGQAIVRRALEMPDAGDVTHVGVTVSPLGADGVGGAICLFSDLTAVVRLEDQLRLKETLARLGELTAGIAHEFRNGLATIHGYGKLLDPAALPPQFRPYVEGIRQETDALGQVVTNFLNFARPTQLSLATHDLRAIVERAVDDVRSEARHFDGQITVAGDFGQVDADDVLLRQAFSNLLRNAVEACEGGGVHPSIRVEGALDAAHGMARVNVLDNGPGVPSDAREQIFRPFFTTKNTGTGLGLALVLKIIVTHNGRVQATNSPDGGACFQVTLPIV